MFTRAIVTDISLDNIPYVRRISAPSRDSRVSVGAAYNKIIGRDSRTGDNVIGYFNADMEMFAWSYMLDYTTDTGEVADYLRLDWHWRHDVPDQTGRILASFQVYHLVPEMESL